jgi:DNA-binding PadR family transcriptional regulator
LEALRPLTPAQEKAIDSALSALKQQGLIDGQRINGSPFLSYRLLPEGKRRLAVLKKRLGQ